jgi:hypothetical protein
MAEMVRLVGHAYELRKELGHGPHGTVWDARDQGTGQHVALKMFDPRFARDPLVVNRFVREETILEAYVHPGYVRVQRLLLEDGYLALVTELVPGIDLERYLHQCAPLPPETAGRVASECAGIVAAGHRLGVVHGDIKPTNVLLVGREQRARITDCRVARLVRGPRGVPADPRYVAPEVTRHEPVVPGTDVYGVGLVLFAMVTGLPLWQGADAADPASRQGYRRRLRQYVADGRLREVIDACLEPDLELRLSAERLVSALAEPAPPPLPVRPPTGVAALPPVAAPAALTSPSSVRVRPDRGAAPAGRRSDRPAARRIRHGGTVAVALVLATVAGLGVAGILEHPRGTGRSGGAASSPAVATTTVGTLARPQPPRAAASQSADGARIAGGFWFDALNYAVATGNTAALTATSDPACDACTALRNAITDAYRAGGSMRGGQYTVRSMSLDAFFDLQRATFRVVFDRGPRTTLDATGLSRTALAPATFAPCQIILGFADGQWHVLAVQSPDPIG